MNIGYHGGVKNKSVSKSVKFHCENGPTNALQIFVKVPKRWSKSKITEEDAKSCASYVRENEISLFSHGSYLVNMCNPNQPQAIENVLDDLWNIERIGGIGSVFHVGKALKLPRHEALNNMENFIRRVLDTAKERSIKSQFILETGAGCGTEICVELEELADLYNRFSEEDKKQFALCIDTCHIFSAGYDIRTEATAREYIDQFGELIGLENVALIHLNDSKCPLGSKKDRHENIGHGFITDTGHAGLAYFMQFMHSLLIPAVLETPCGYAAKKEELEYVRNELITFSNVSPLSSTPHAVDQQTEEVVKSELEEMEVEILNKDLETSPNDS